MGGGGRRVDLSFITATSDKILTGYIGCDQDGNQVEGTMPNNGRITGSIYAGGYYTIPAGYTSGGGVEAAPLSVQTQGTAGVADIAVGKTAWVNGTKLTGTKHDVYSREFLLNLEDYDNAGSVSGTANFIESSEATSCLININCEELGGTGFFPLQSSTSSTIVTKQFTIQNEIRVGISLTMYPSGKEFDVEITATNIGTEYLYYDFFVDIIRAF